MGRKKQKLGGGVDKAPVGHFYSILLAVNFFCCVMGIGMGY